MSSLSLAVLAASGWSLALTLLLQRHAPHLARRTTGPGLLLVALPLLLIASGHPVDRRLALGAVVGGCVLMLVGRRETKPPPGAAA